MPRYPWAARGDVNAFFGLMLDNVAVLIVLFSTLTVGGFTPEFVLTRMIPGTALGVLLGDLVYTALAFRLARRTGNPNVTAMPLGLDTPSTFGVAFLILLPALNAKNLPHDERMLFAWRVGLVVLVFVGLFKVLFAPLGNAVRRLVPRAGLLGSLAAIALALISFLPLVLEGIAGVPMVGMVALVVVLVTLVAHRQLPGKFPGALAAVLLGVLVYQAGRGLGWLTGWPVVPPMRGVELMAWRPFDLLAFYGGSAEEWGEVLAYAAGRLPLALPFALATILGGIDCTESAAAAGDEYDTRAVLMTEGVASLAAGLLGGVIQNTPYIGHPAYKKMGGRAAYTLATALFVGAVGYFGGFRLLFAWLPTAAMFPILVFVGLEITAQSFQATPTRHYAAVAFAALPALAYLCVTAMKATVGLSVPAKEDGQVALQALRCLANGFLITSLLWAAALATLLDGRPGKAAAYFAVAGACAFFGVIHSPLPDERIDLPWRALADVPGPMWDAARYQTPYHWSAAYGLVALLLLGLGLASRERERPEEKDEPRA
jgi:AGZA family xanthine/uracil permease-like MFS transporter